MQIRPAGLDDLPEITRRMFEHYNGRLTAQRVPAGLRWMRAAILNPSRLVLIGPHSFGMAQVDTFYGFERRALVDILCSRPVPGAAFESLRMLRKMVAWARRKGARELKFDADTGVDFSPFARRLGAETVTVRKHRILL